MRIIVIWIIDLITRISELTPVGRDYSHDWNTEMDGRTFITQSIRSYGKYGCRGLKMANKSKQKRQSF